MSWQQTVEQTVTGLGYDLVDLDRSAGGLLRVTIDLPWDPTQAGVEQFVTVEDCEKITRQLQYLLEVENVDYKRLEVGSPGIDRPLRNENDFIRFAGQEVDITLKEPIGVTGTTIAANRKKFRGTLERPESGEGWQIVWSDAPERKPGARISKKAKPLPVQVLGFTLEEIREARLAPIVSFKGRGTTPAADTDLNNTAAEYGKAGE
jgi:ribosome maturation factor RimP